MDAERLRAYLLTLPHVAETMQWGRTSSIGRATRPSAARCSRSSTWTSPPNRSAPPTNNRQPATSNCFSPTPPAPTATPSAGARRPGSRALHGAHPLGRRRALEGLQRRGVEARAARRVRPHTSQAAEEGPRHPRPARRRAAPPHRRGPPQAGQKILSASYTEANERSAQPKNEDLHESHRPASHVSPCRRNPPYCASAPLCAGLGDSQRCTRLRHNRPDGHRARTPDSSTR